MEREDEDVNRITVFPFGKCRVGFVSCNAGDRKSVV